MLIKFSLSLFPPAWFHNSFFQCFFFSWGIPRFMAFTVSRKRGSAVHFRPWSPHRAAVGTQEADFAGFYQKIALKKHQSHGNDFFSKVLAPPVGTRCSKIGWQSIELDWRTATNYAYFLRDIGIYKLLFGLRNRELSVWTVLSALPGPASPSQSLPVPPRPSRPLPANVHFTSGWLIGSYFAPFPVISQHFFTTKNAK